jgi:tetratricopeptide (TPR) repeat protein
MDLYFQGRAWFNKGMTPAYLAEARRFFERALALDPANVEALVGVAGADMMIAGTFLPDDRVARLAAAEAATTNALSLAPEHAIAHLVRGGVQMNTNRVPQGISECERALELDRNLAAAHGAIGNAKLLLGQFEESEAHIQEALRLSPRDPYSYLWGHSAGMAKFYLGNEEDAATWLRRSIETNRNFPLSHFALAATLARLGRLPEARSEAQAGLAINPTYTVSRFRVFAHSNNPTYLAARERLIDGLRKAGVPEE